MKIRRVTSPDDIPWGLKMLRRSWGIWLTRHFNKILITNKVSHEWRRNLLVPICKNKGDIQKYTNYHEVRLMSHSMKLWERVREQRLRRPRYLKINFIIS